MFDKLHYNEIMKLLEKILLGMFGALILLLLQALFFHPTVRIATVNITSMVDSFVKETAKQKISPDEMKQRVTQFGQALNTTMEEISKKKHIVLVPSEAVIAGAPDLTFLVEEAVKEDLKK